MAAPDYGPFFQASGQMHDIDPLLLQAIQMQEDRSGAPNAVGPPNETGERAIGVMQFLPTTAKKYGIDPNDPGSAILGAGAYLADLRKNTNDNLPQMLATYGGGNATGYANSVINTYHQLQKSWGINAPPADDRGDTSSAAPTPTSGDQGGIKITAHALPGPGGAQQGGASFVPPPGTPDTFGRSNARGSRAQHPMQASEYSGGDQPPKDFNAALFGPEPAKETPPAQGQPAPSVPAPAPAPATPDFETQLFGPTGTAGVTPQPDRAADARAAAPTTSPMVTPPQPSWFETNVAAPVRSMYDPTQGAPMNYLLGQPLLQNIGAGVFQGTRNVAQRLNEWEQAADQNYPWLANLDRAAAANSDVQSALSAVNRWMPSPVSVGGTQAQLADTGQRLAAETKAYRTQYGDSLPAAGGEIAGNLLTTYPLAALGWGLRGLGEALPVLRGLTETGNVAGTSAGQNILTTPGQDWRTAGAQGAAGGLAVHGVLGSIAGQFARGAVPQAVQDANDLGFNLTSGEAGGGFPKQVEDVSQYLPGSGAAAKEAEHRAVINRVLTRNMGIPETPVLNSATLQTARAHAGNLMDQIQKITVDANKDPKLLSELGDIQAEAAAQPMTGTSITGAVDKVLGSLDQNGMLSGNALHDLIKSGAPLDRLTQSKDSVIKAFAQRIRTSLQDAASRTADPTIYPNATAADRQAVNDFNQGRYNWKVIKTVEPLVEKTGSADEATYAGLAQRIRGPVNSPNFDPRFGGDMPKLQRVLSGPLAALKSSGTGRQMITAGLLKTLVGEGGLGAGLAALAPENFNSYLAAMMPTLATIGAGRISRYGPGLGNPITGAAGQLFNPLLPRVLGPGVATNPLLNPPQQGQ